MNEMHSCHNIDFLSLFRTINQAPFPDVMKQGLIQFYESYHKAVQSLPSDWEKKQSFNRLQKALESYIHLISQEVQNPTIFQHFHVKETAPFDFFQFGLDMVLPLIDEEKSIVLGSDQIEKIDYALSQNENVIFLSNHQAEIDPQIISLLTAPFSKRLSEDIICVAGHRVTQDPLAIPFSRGRNLICIYSKKYIDHPPEKKAEKLQHNSKAIGAIEEFLEKGGSAIYVAPSGGRDRVPLDGKELQPAAFDPQSVEMFRLLSKKSSRPTHFHLLALHTIDQLPPPKGINIQLGEERIAARAPTGLYISPPLDMEAIDHQIVEGKLNERLSQDSGLNIKQEKRALRAEYLHEALVTMYRDLYRNIHA